MRHVGVMCDEYVQVSPKYQMRRHPVFNEFLYLEHITVMEFFKPVLNILEILPIQYNELALHIMLVFTLFLHLKLHCSLP